MSAVFDLPRFNQMPLIAILRGGQIDQIEGVVDSLVKGGFAALEITMNSVAPAMQIAVAASAANGRLMIGAGTVTSLSGLEVALRAGATFVVTPTTVPEVILTCVRRGIPVFPGAFTPTEIQQAANLGATMVKLFPANRLGPDYIRDLRAPFETIPLLATGGITPENMPDYVRAGASGFGIGSPLFNPDKLKEKDWPWLMRRAADFCAAWQRSEVSP